MKSQRIIPLLAAILFFASPVFAADIYVSPAGTGDGSIGNATDLQSALNTAITNGQDDIIYLQQGTYTGAGTTAFTYNAVGGDNRSVAISGGWNTEYTLQTEDNTLTALDGQGLRRVLYILADAGGTSVTFYIENLSIQNGYLTATTEPAAGIRVNPGISPNNGTVNLYIRDSRFYNNSTDGSSGGALLTYNYFEISNSSFISNRARNGGAIYIGPAPGGNQAIAPVIDGCTFEDNHNNITSGWQGSTIFNNVALVLRDSSISGRAGGASSGLGSALYNHTNANPTILNSIFRDINIQAWGAAVQFWSAGGTVTNCLFLNDVANGGGGGAIAIYDPTSPSSKTVRVTNSTFAGNSSTLSVGAIHNRIQNLYIYNSIFWGNPGTDIYRESGYAEIGDSDVEGGLTGTNFTDKGGNINLAPAFIGSGNYRLSTGSPCIDTGNNTPPNISMPLTDLFGYTRIADGGIGSPIVDMGAYEYDKDPPTGGILVVTEGDTKILLNWSRFIDPGGIASYRLVVSELSTPADCSGTGPGETLLYSGSNMSYQHEALLNAKNYFYRVCAIDNTNNTSLGAFNQGMPGGPPVRIAREPEFPYMSVRDAYDAALGDDLIQLRETGFFEALVFDRDVAVTVAGAYDPDFSDVLPDSYSDLYGSLTVINGAVTIREIIIW